MRAAEFIPVAGLLVIAVLVLLRDPATSISSPTVVPQSIPANLTSIVTIAANVSEASLVTNSVMVVRVNQNGEVIATLGALSDDGTGHHRYQGQFSLHEPAAGNVYLKVTAAYRGADLRSTSAVLALSVRSTFRFPLKMSTNRRFFVDQDGSPFLLVGDAPMSLVSKGSPAQQEAYFAERQSKGFNAAWINLLCADYTGCPANGRTATGVAPFTSGDTPSNYDLALPNQSYFALYDAALTLAESHGIVVFLDPIETGGWLVTLKNNGSVKAFNYGVFVGSLYRNHPNLVWLHGNDFAGYTTSADNQLVGQVIAGIASVDTRHLQTLELGTESFLTNSDTYSNQDHELSGYLGADLAYSWGPTYNVVLRAYNSTPTSPVFLGEGNYEFENIINRLLRPTDTFLLRETAYWALTSGAAGYMYGNHYTWTSEWIIDPGKRLSTPGSAQVPYVHVLFNALRWWDLTPDQTHSIVTAGYGQYVVGNSDPAASNYCSTAWNPDGTASLTYCPAATTLQVDMARFSGPVQAWWFDPAAGTFHEATASPFPNRGTQRFPSPGRNREGRQDWALMLKVQ